MVGGIAVLEYGTLQYICVEAGIWAGIVGDDSFDCFHSDLRSAV